MSEFRNDIKAKLSNVKEGHKRLTTNFSFASLHDMAIQGYCYFFAFCALFLLLL
ncbi:hypothetical protein ACJX0J_025915, partial [Zea mays]